MTIAIITPVFNGERHIHDYMEAIYQQLRKDFDIIFVDDDSSDQTRSMLEAFALKHGNIHILENNVNLGPGLSRDKALAHILLKEKYRYVAFLDIDDRWEKNKFNAQLKKMENLKSNFSATEFRYEINTEKKDYKEITLDNILTSRDIALSSVMIEISLLKKFKQKYGGQFFRYRRAEDYAFWIKLFPLMQNPILINEKLLSYNRSGKQLSSNKLLQAFAVLKVYNELVSPRSLALRKFSEYVWNKLI